ncbi:di-trans,poly-cis-decaprenylcistransferase [Patescibacteria group bacterium]|nr:di-trans,poly-cis-decaprenylcistransferase [Patescibacteria group bacterium]
MNKLPQHIAIICDGNRRWARKKGKSEFSGHKYATDHTTEALVNHCLKLRIPYLTFWVLSTENWKRGQTWMKQYFKLMHYFFDKKMEILTKKGAKIVTSGDLSPFPKSLQTKINQVVDQSKNNKNITINIAINYGGRDEIVRAINKLFESRSVLEVTTSRPDLKGLEFVLGPEKTAGSEPSKFQDSSDASHLRKLTSKDFQKYLDTPTLPNPDLLIRTGENNQRLSNFMLWQLAYTQLYFTNTLFPDFKAKELDQAILWWQTQTQNLGK